MDIELTGMTELLGKLESLRTQVPGPEMKKAIRAGANVIRDAIEEATPVQAKRSGPNSSSLEPGVLAEGMRVYLPPQADPVEAVIGPKSAVDHVAVWVEGGHRNVKGGYSKIAGTGTRGPGHQLKDAEGSASETPAHEFIRPAFEGSLPQAEAAMQESLNHSIEELTR